jgi:hypothetical protein
VAGPASFFFETPAPMPLEPASPQPGDRCPDFLLPPAGGLQETFHARHAGRALALILAREPGILTRYAELEDTDAVFALVAGDAGHRVPAPIPAMCDHGVLTTQLGLRDDVPGTRVWIVDPTLCLRHLLDDPSAAQVRDALSAAAAESGAAAPALRRRAAPVLILRDVFDAGLCRRLVAAHAVDHHGSGMLRLVDGRPVLVPDARAKQRLDHRLVDPELVDEAVQVLSRRVLPEIGAAFHYPVTRMEGFKVAAYPAGSGWFRLHRDNVTPDARHRRFAVTVALDDDFDGGALRFPEYGPDLYRPPAGGAIVFSGTLLHEVTDVTRGRRHVLLTFLWGDDAGR